MIEDLTIDGVISIKLKAIGIKIKAIYFSKTNPVLCDRDGTKVHNNLITKNVIKPICIKDSSKTFRRLIKAYTPRRDKKMIKMLLTTMEEKKDKKPINAIIKTVISSLLFL